MLPRLVHRRNMEIQMGIRAMMGIMVSKVGWRSRRLHINHSRSLRPAVAERGEKEMAVGMIMGHVYEGMDFNE
jgi:hypothetical protein